MSNLPDFTPEQHAWEKDMNSAGISPMTAFICGIRLAFNYSEYAQALLATEPPEVTAALGELLAQMVKRVPVSVRDAS